MSDSATTSPARNAPSANDTPKTVEAMKAMPSAIASTASVKSSRDPSRATTSNNHGTKRAPTTTMTTAKTTALTSARTIGIRRSVACAPAARGVRSAQERGDGREEHQHDDRQQVLDDQPADRDPTLGGVQLVAVGQGAQDDDGAGDRDRQAEDEAATQAPAQRGTEPDAEQPRNDRLDDRPRDRDRADGEELADRELDPDAEHQQDHPELGELERDVGVGTQPGRERPDHHASDDVPDDGGQADMPGDETADECGSQADRDSGDENGLVVQGGIPLTGGAQDWRGSVPERRRK